MPRFRKKPVEVEAFQMTEERWGSTDWPDWIHEAWRKDGGDGALWLGGDGETLYCGTLEGVARINWDDWIIRGIEGVYPCKPSIFEATYEEVEEPLEAPPRIRMSAGQTG